MIQKNNNLKTLIVISLTLVLGLKTSVFAQNCSLAPIPTVNFTNQGGTQYTLGVFNEFDPECSYKTFDIIGASTWVYVAQIEPILKGLPVYIQVSCLPNDAPGAAQRSAVVYLSLFGGLTGVITITQEPSCHKNWYLDSDGDGFGDKHSEPISSCSDPSESGKDYVNNNDDHCPDEANTSNYGCPSDYEYENIDINWITSKAYDIKGNLKASSKAYYNDLGKPIQTQSVDVKTNRTWANQTLYDAQGRPALTTLSAPINSTGKPTYKSDFIRDENNHTYSRNDFENDPENPTPVGKATANTLGRYYSTYNVENSNTQTGNNYQDITDYPFSRTIYSNLNPGAVLKTIGGNKQEGKWKQGYTFSMPAGDELTRPEAFNDNSYKVDATNANARKIIKTINRDVHGNEVVVFSDTDGKTLAAARTGGTAVRNTKISIGTQGFVDVHVPKGNNAVGFTINGVLGITTEVYNLITEQVTTTATGSLTNGFYRVSITNLDSYNPTSPATTVAIDCKENYYDYSLKAYDEAGRLVSSKQPLQHLESTFEYNALGQLTQIHSPDEGDAWFLYRKDGQIRFSTNSKQWKNKQFSYTNYDALGRPVESGVYTDAALGYLNTQTTTVTKATDPFKASLKAIIDIADGDGLSNANRSEVQETLYDVDESTKLDAAIATIPNAVGKYAQTFLAGNVSRTNNNNTTTWYSYDVYGRVKWIVQKIPGLGTKTIDYKYDQITGAVLEVDFQRHLASDHFVHRYTYDSVDDQLIKVETSTNGSTFTTHANYEYYYESGALKRLEIAPLNNTGAPLQGMDYVYNLNGQLKSINHPSLLANNDPGGDANDLFGMQIDYHSGDYSRTERSNISSPNYGEDQFNGNIKGIRWNNKTLENTERTFSYYYNKNNWLTDAIYGQYADVSADDFQDNIFDDATHIGVAKSFNATTSVSWLPGFHAKPNTGQTVTAKIVSGTASKFQSEDYNVFDITYDANGNIRTLNRNKNTSGGQNKMDQLNYIYKSDKPNQLLRVDDAAGEVLTGKDIGDQDGDNYIYNSIGQLVENKEEGIKYVYNASGLVTEIKKNNVTLVKFYYNDKGHRVRKDSWVTGSLKTDYYIRDAAGTALAIYRGTTVKEHTIYGASRLGVYNKADGSSYYQLTDHLGNVRAVTGRASNGIPLAIVSATDYYPGGMAMPNRNVVGDYRYGYQGEYAETDPETGKVAFELRLYDPRINRWLTTDPAGQFHSPYMSMGNNWVSRVDPDGAYSPPTDYVDENGNLLMHTEDGSNAVITVTNDKLEGFLASVRGTSIDALNSKDWNFTMKSYLVGREWTQTMENVQSWFATPQARGNVSRYWQTGDIDYWAKASNEHSASFRDPVSWGLAIAGGLTGYLGNFRKVGQWMTPEQYQGFKQTGIIPRGNVLTKGAGGFSDPKLTHYVEFRVHQSFLRTKDAARGWQSVIQNTGVRQRLATQRGVILPKARAFDINLISN